MNETIEYKASLTIDEAGTITGLAWPFGSADLVGDIIEPIAFKNMPATVPMLFHHDGNQAVGVWTSIVATPEGLQVKGKLLIDDVARAREVRALIREGAAPGLSISFANTKSTRRAGGRGRTITALDLREISVTPIPCHPGARITSAKAAQSANDRNHMEDQITDATTDFAAIEAKVASVEAEVKSFGKLTERLDRFEAKLNRPALMSGTDEDAGIARKAYDGFVRRGEALLSSDERKALVVANDAAGGYLAPEALSGELLAKLVEYSPIRSYARVVTIGAESIKLTRKTSGTSAFWVDEIEDRTASQPAFEQISIKPWELATYTDVSNKLLEDNTYNLESELIADFAENFGKTEGVAFVKGTGVTQPKGLMTAAGIAEVKTGLAGGFPVANPADVLIGMFHALPTVHAQRAQWLMNRLTLGEMRKWKDGNGRYLVIDPISEGAPLTLLGRPIVEAVDMDDIGANKFPILFGDLQGYRIVDRIGFATLRDPYSLATKGQTRIHARKRVGADVTNPDRFVKLKIAV